jgi:hypothetical protein
MKGKGRLFLTLGVIAILIIVFSQCMNQGQHPKAAEDAVAGAKTCKQCHSKIYDDYLQNPHAHTSAPATGEGVVAGGDPADNTFAFDKRLKVVVEHRKDGIYQVSYVNGKEGVATALLFQGHQRLDEQSWFSAEPGQIFPQNRCKMPIVP